MIAREIARRFSDSTRAVSPLLTCLFENLVKQRRNPCFLLNSNQIQILDKPIEYFLALNQGILQAQKRIKMSALYIGNSKLDLFLLHQIEKKISSDIDIGIQVDYSRGMRLEKDGKSCMSALIELKHKYRYNNFKVTAFQHPDVGWMQGSSFNMGLREIFGVYHIKAAVFDDNVLLTGANLNSTYYTDRQDRCWICYNCKPLADYVDELLSVFASYEADGYGELVLKKHIPVPNENKKEYKAVLSHQLDFFRYRNKTNIPVDFDYKIENILSQKVNVQDTIDKNVDNDLNEIVRSMGEDPNELQHSIVKLGSRPGALESTGKKVYIFPCLQVPPIKFREDQKIMSSLLEVARDCCKEVRVASGYFNLPQDFIMKMMNSKCQYNLLAASPRANGFFQAGFFKKFIPIFYRCYEYSLLNKLPENAVLYEYFREGWTFHGKGMWFYPKDGLHPELTVIGSSNFARRSYDRDVELEFYVYSDCPDFQQRLHAESSHLFESAHQISRKEILSDKDIKITTIRKILGRIFNSFL